MVNLQMVNIYLALHNETCEVVLSMQAYWEIDCEHFGPSYKYKFCKNNNVSSGSCSESLYLVID